MSFSDEVVAGLREEYRTRFGKHKDMAQQTNATPGFLPSASERQAADIRKSAGLPEPLSVKERWRNEACDESGLPVALVPGRSADVQALIDGPYVTKDSGQRDVFETGCQRDLGEGKGAYDLIPVRPLRRLAQLYERGAKKYNDHNWRRGMPFGRVIQSMIRHAEQFRECVEPEDSEDHLAAVAWNAFTLMEYVEAISKGQLPAELDDRFRYKPPCTER